MHPSLMSRQFVCVLCLLALAALCSTALASADLPAAAAVPSPDGAEASSSSYIHGRKLADSVSKEFQEAAIARFAAGPGRVGPWSRNWTNSIAICATMKQENITDVIEWIEHYRWLGVDRILLTENDDVQSAHPQLQPYIDSGFVLYSIEPTPRGQLVVYGHCLQDHGADYDWMAFFDIDEFLILRKPDETLKGLLDDFKLFPGLIVHWVIFGSSNRETRPEEGGVMEAYTRCQPKPRQTFKTIANMVYTADVSNAHTVSYKSYNHPVNEARYPASHTLGHPGHLELCENATEPTSECELRPASSLSKEVSTASAERVALFHYVLKSREDFDNKHARGSGDHSVPKDDAFFEKVNRSASRGGGICSEGRVQAKRRLEEGKESTPDAERRNTRQAIGRAARQGRGQP